MRYSVSTNPRPIRTLIWGDFRLSWLKTHYRYNRFADFFHFSSYEKYPASHPNSAWMLRLQAIGYSVTLELL